MMEIFIILYIICVTFAFASTIKLIEISDIINNKYDIFILIIFVFLIASPILNLIPTILCLYYLTKNH